MKEGDASDDALLREVAAAPPRAPSPPDPWIGRRLAHFQIRRRLGAGGMGAVYLADDERLLRPVALKLLTGPAPHAALEEARKAAAVRHPGVAAVYEVSEEQGVGFIAFEWVEGLSLRQALPRRGFGGGRVLELATELAAGLAAAHAAGVVHRDFKPENVVLGREGRAKLVDFGLASQAERSALDSPGLGTHGYLAPERLSGGPARPTEDVFSFGVVLAELLGDRGGTPLRAGLLSLARACRAAEPSARPADGAELSSRLARLRAARARRRVAVGAVVILAALVLAGRSRPPPPVPRFEEERLTALPQEARLVDGALDVSGTELAYIDGQGVHRRPLAGGADALVPLEQGWIPSLLGWLPDGALAVAAARSGKESRVYRLERSGAASVLFDSDDALLVLQPSPTTGAVATGGLREVALHGAGTRRTLLAMAPGELALAVAWSPDGRRLAVLRGRTLAGRNLAQLLVLGLEGGEPVQVLEEPNLVLDSGGTALAWSGSGALLYGRKDALEPQARVTLWEQPLAASGAAEGAPRRLYQWAGSSPFRLTRSSATGAIAYLRTDAQSDVEVGELADGGASLSGRRRVTLSDFDESAPCWLPGGGLVYRSQVKGVSQLWLQDAPEQAPRAVPGGPTSLATPLSNARGFLAWADGVLLRLDGRLRPLSALEGQPVVGRGGGPPPLLRCASRAEQCWLEASEAPRGELWLRRLEASGRTGPVLKVGPADPLRLGWALGPDGQSVVYADPHSQLVERVIASGELLRSYAAPDCRMQSAAVSADGTRVYATGMCAGEGSAYRLISFPREGGGPPSLLVGESMRWLAEPTPDPSGTQLAWVTRSYDTDLWVLVPR